MAQVCQDIVDQSHVVPDVVDAFASYRISWYRLRNVVKEIKGDEERNTHVI